MRLLKGPLFTAALGCLLCLFAGASGASNPALMINRLTLICSAPGGPRDNPACYPPDALPSASFEVIINNELGTSAVEDYYLDRARLLAGSYSVLVYAADDYRPQYNGRPARPIAVLGPDNGGSFRLDQAGLEPGGRYAWVLTAQVASERGPLTLWSTPLYFNLLPDEPRVPPQLGAADQQALRTLINLAAQQERAREGARMSLRGLAMYYNFAAASDTYYCAPLDERSPSPWADAQPGGWPLAALLQLGDCAAEALVLQTQLDSARGTPDLQRAHRLGDAVVSLSRGLAGASSEPGPQLDELAATGARLAGCGLGELPGLVSELLISLDSVAGTGSRPLPQTGIDGFPAYARASLRRLEAVEEYGALLQTSMRPDDWAAWSETLRQMRAELTLLADDVERGRLTRIQLEGQLDRARQIVPPVYPDEWRFLERGGEFRAELASRIGLDEHEQRRRLARELYWRQLSRLLRLVIPPRENNAG